MIDSLDHLTLPLAAKAKYEALLGRRPVDGSIRTGNVAVAFADGVSGLQSMTFAVDDLDKAVNLLERRAVAVTRKGNGASIDGNGVALQLTTKTSDVPSPVTVDEPSAVSALDHVVIRTPNPERAIAFYGARLGLSLRLDRSNSSWGQRLMFFRCGDLVVEVAHDLKRGVSDAPDQLWGLSWRVPDIAKANARLKAAGIEVDAPRDGRRPGSQVFTVKSGTGGVPTIVIGGIGRW